MVLMMNSANHIASISLKMRSAKINVKYKLLIKNPLIWWCFYFDLFASDKIKLENPQCHASCWPHHAFHFRDIQPTSSSKFFLHFLGWKNKCFQNCSKLPKTHFWTIKIYFFSRFSITRVGQTKSRKFQIFLNPSLTRIPQWIHSNSSMNSLGFLNQFTWIPQSIH